MNGQKVTVNCDNASFFGFPQKDFTVGNYCSYSGETLYDLEGKNFGSCTLGFCMRTNRVSRGTYNFSITYGNTIYKLKIIVTY